MHSDTCRKTVQLTCRYIYPCYNSKSSSSDSFSTPIRNAKRTEATDDFDSPDEDSVETSDYSAEFNGKTSLFEDDMSHDASESLSYDYLSESDDEEKYSVEESDASDDDDDGIEDDASNGNSDKGGLKTEGLDDYECSEDDDDSNKGEDESTGSTEDLFNVDQALLEKKMNKAFAETNGDTIDIWTSEILKHKEERFVAIFVGAQDPCWYNICEQFKTGITCLLQASKRSVPDFIETLLEHKLRVEYSPGNEMVFRSSNQKYPLTRWCMVAKLNSVNPPDHLEIILKKFSKMFKQMYSNRPGNTPGRRFMSFVANSGRDSLLNGCKKYMQGDDSDIERIVNEELITLGKKGHVYNHGCSLDKFWPDGNIKLFLEHFLGAASWDDVSEKNKKICYSKYPRRDLPDWGRMA